MPRKKNFNYDTVIDRATRLFWAKGYSGASLRDLLRVMRIGEGSFYNTVKGKDDLYLLCLRHYNDTVTRRRWDILIGEPSVRRGARKFFASILDDLDDPKVPNVCLMAASLSPDVLRNKGFKDYIVGEMELREHMIALRLKEAKERGELSGDFDAALTAQIFVTFLQGLFRVARVLKMRKTIERQIEAFLVGIGL